MANELYIILGLKPHADEREIRSAYRTLVKRFHPDTGEGSSEERFRAIQNAYEVLSDPEQRRAYDLRQQRSGPETMVLSRPYSRPVFREPTRSGHIDLRHLATGGRGEPLRFRTQMRTSGIDDSFAEVQRLFRLLDDFFRF